MGTANGSHECCFPPAALHCQMQCQEQSCEKLKEKCRCNWNGGMKVFSNKLIPYAISKRHNSHVLIMAMCYFRLNGSMPLGTSCRGTMVEGCLHFLLVDFPGWSLWESEHWTRMSLSQRRAAVDCINSTLQGGGFQVLFTPSLLPPAYCRQDLN